MKKINRFFYSSMVLSNYIYSLSVPTGLCINKNSLVINGKLHYLFSVVAGFIAFGFTRKISMFFFIAFCGICVSSIIDAIFLNIYLPCKYKAHRKNLEKMAEARKARKELEEIEKAMAEAVFDINKLETVSNDLLAMVKEAKKIKKETRALLNQVFKQVSVLINAISANNVKPEKFRMLFEVYLPDVVNIVISRANSSNLSEDVTEDTICNFIKNFINYLEQEIEHVGTIEKMNTVASIEVYNQIFRSNSMKVGIEDENK